MWPGTPITTHKRPQASQITVEMNMIFVEFRREKQTANVMLDMLLDENQRFDHLKRHKKNSPVSAKWSREKKTLSIFLFARTADQKRNKVIKVVHE